MTNTEQIDKAWMGIFATSETVDELTKEKENLIREQTDLKKQIYNLVELQKLQNNLNMYDKNDKWQEPLFVVFLFNVNLMIFNFLNKIVSFYRKVILSNKVFRKIFFVKQQIVDIGGGISYDKRRNVLLSKHPCPKRYNHPREVAEAMGHSIG